MSDTPAPPAPPPEAPAPLISARTLLPGLGLLALYLLIRLPLLDVPLDRDEGAFGLIGQAILRGELPYRDIFDHKPPGVFYIYALLMGPDTAGVHGMLAGINACALLAVAFFAARLYGRTAGWWTAFFFVLASSAFSVQGFTASTEMLLLYPLVFSIALTHTALDRTGWRAAWRFLLAGAFGAGACWIKQSAAAPLLVAPLLIVLHHGTARWTCAAKGLALWLAGGVALSAMVVLPFVLAGAGEEFWYWSFGHSMAYGKLSWYGAGERLAAALVEILRDLALPLALGVAGSVALVVQKRKHAWLPPAFLILSFAACCHAGFFYKHYFAQWAPGIALAAGVGAALLQEKLTAHRARAAAWFVPGLILVVLLATAFGRPWYWLWPDGATVTLRAHGPQGFAAGEKIAEYLHDQTKPDDTIFIYGSEPQLAFLAERRLANPFVMAYPFTGPFERQRAFQERVWSEIKGTRPAFLILTSNPVSLNASSRTDPFLAENLARLGQRAYTLAAVVVREPDGAGYKIVSGLSDADRATLGPRILYELWRKKPREGP